MIIFKHGKVEKTNASVFFEDEKDKVDAFSERDAEGHIKVTIDVEMEPDDGASVKLILHNENDSEYTGTIKHDKDCMIFTQ